MMKISEFTERFIDGYLFSDLKVMSEIHGQGGGDGALVFPMIMSCLSGVELFGALLSRDKFDPFQGRAQFVDYWTSCMYKNKPQAGVADAVYSLVRNGVAHSFGPKIQFVVTKSGRNHLCRDGQTVIVDALTLHKDLVASFEIYLRPALADDVMSVRIQSRLDEIQASNDNKLTKAMSEAILHLPVASGSLSVRCEMAGSAASLSFNGTRVPERNKRSP